MIDLVKNDEGDMSQISFPDDRPVDDLDEQLVAYLDGELPPDEIREVEKRLASDAALRSRLRQLQNGWDLLDELPLTSSSSTLLETTIRMAAVGGDVLKTSSKNSVVSRRWFTGAWLLASILGFFLLGLAIVRVGNYVRYQQQLRELPVAMHLDAYLHSTDVELMKTLAQMPQWQDASQFAEQLGEWNFDLAEQIDEATPKAREQLLTSLPIEDQETVAGAWERFENVSEEDQRQAVAIAQRVAELPDAKSVLKTMDRFAAWRESLPAEERDRLTNGTEAQKQEAIRHGLERTVRQWTRQRGRDLSDANVETIYQALREIGRLRLKSLEDQLPPAFVAGLKQSMDPRFEAMLLSRLFLPDFGQDGPPRRDNEFRPTTPPPNQNGQPLPPAPRQPQFSPPGMPPGFSQFREFTDRVRDLTEQVRGPLSDDEVYMLESVIPKNLSDMLDAASSLPVLRNELVRSWVEESLSRTIWNRNDGSLVERYQARDPNDRETIDLLPADELLRSLQGDRRGRR